MKFEDLKDNPVARHSFEFALMVEKYCSKLYELRRYDLARQLFRAGTSVGANVFEAQHPESNADFIHKMKMTLKEIRETRVNLRIIIEKPFLNIENTKAALKEADELIAIFLKSITTAKHRTIRQGSPTYSFLIFHFLFFIFTDIFISHENRNNRTNQSHHC